MKREVMSCAAAAFVHISHLWMTVLFLCCSMCGGLLQLYSNVSFESAWVREPLHTWTQHGQEDNLPPPLHLHRKRQPQVISGIISTLGINGPTVFWNTVTYHCSSTRSELPFIPSADLFLSHSCIPARSAWFPSAYICVNTNPDTHMQAHAYLQSEYCSLSEKRCELIFHVPPLAESQSISQHSHMLDV